MNADRTGLEDAVGRVFIWWTGQTDCETITALSGRGEGYGPTTWPSYLADQYAYRYGRNGRGRLWVSPHLRDVVVDPWPSIEIATSIGGNYGGIAISADDHRHVIGLPGFVTDLRLILAHVESDLARLDRPVKNPGETLHDVPLDSEEAADRIEALEAARIAIINTPETADFMAGVPIEATHQRERWGVEHDAGKSPFDWFWLIGYLAQKAADASVRGDVEKAKHHTISTAAALANWHAALTGADTSMRPGIGPDNGGEKPGSAHNLAAALAGRDCGDEG